MDAPSKINFKVYQGSTFSEVVRWESANKVYKIITDVSKSAPMIVTAIAHGMTVGWRAKLANIVGMKEANTGDTYLTATSVSSNTITFGTINSSGYTTYTSGGTLEYNAPVDLTGKTARMQIREKVSSTTVIDTLTTENGGIVIDVLANTITLSIPATTTAAYTFKTAVYSIEIVNGAVVIPLAQGNLTLQSEITR